ncbi:MAG TPA: hypothetical protein VFC65_09025 [Prolixibacteraceae bacterium]|nr:hypothetical protein [Prolixibacteraceae bacterium]
MDLKDLKSAWDTYSSQEEDKHRLGKENIHELLKIRTKTMVERFDRNIKIGMFVLGVYITYILLDYLFVSEYLSKAIADKSIEYPKWLELLDIFSSVLIILTYLFFVLRYVRIKRSFSPDTQLKDFLSGIHNTLITYRRMFYLAVIILLINIILGFAAGLYQGIKIKTDLISGGIENLATSKILIITGVGLGILIPLVAFTFFILRWGFNKLYGRYLIKLNETLHELDESFGPK